MFLAVQRRAARSSKADRGRHSLVGIRDAPASANFLQGNDAGRSAPKRGRDKGSLDRSICNRSNTHIEKIGRPHQVNWLSPRTRQSWRGLSEDRHQRGLISHALWSVFAPSADIAPLGTLRCSIDRSFRRRGHACADLAQTHIGLPLFHGSSREGFAGRCASLSFTVCLRG